MLIATMYDDVTQIKMSREVDGKGIYWVAAYLVDGLLVDTGCMFTAQELLDFLKDKDVLQVVNTHFHEDHVGANKLLQEQRGVAIYAHPDSIPLIASRQFLYPYQEFVWGYPELSVTAPVPAVIKTNKYTFSVIETPGHSAGHISLIERSKGWCFSGDIYSRVKVKFIRPEEDVADCIASMKKILSMLTERLVLFTSVGKIVEDGRRELSDTINYFIELAEQVAMLLHKGCDADTIINTLFGGEHSFADLTNGQYTTRNLVNSLITMVKSN